MVVTCPKCSTSYEFDETLVGHKGTVVRCTQCSHMFKIFADESEDALRKAGWMVRKAGGKVFGIDRFATIQKWIREGKITPDDELSRTGKRWKRIRDIVELQKLFVERPPAGGDPGAGQEVAGEQPRLSIQADDSALQAMASPPPEKPAAGRAAPREEVREVELERSEPEDGTVKGPLAHSLTGREGDLPPDESDRLLMPGYRPGRVKKVVLVVVLLVAAALGVVGYLQRELIMGWVSGIQDPAVESEREKALERAHEYFLLDTGSYLDQAEKIYRDLLDTDPNDPRARASLAELLAVRAQAARDRRELYGREAEVQDAGTIAREAEKLARLAVLADPDDVRANRALADALRLTGDLEEAHEYIDRALDLAPRDPETLYVAVLIDRAEGMELEEAIEDMERIVKRPDPPLRVRYRLALYYALAGDKDRSLSQAESILEVNPDHALAARLMDAVDSVRVATAAGADAAGAADAGEAPDAEDPAAEPAPEPPASSSEKPARASSPPAGTGGGGEGGGGVPGGKSYDFYIGKAIKLQQGGSCDEAMDYFARALEVRPTSTEAHSGMAYCYLSKHQLSAAVASFKRALKTNRSYGPALIGLAQALEKKGDAAGAIEYYERYLDVHSSGGQAAMARNKIKKLEKSTSSGASPAEGGQDGTGSEVEIKNSVGQPSSDEPTTAGDPYD